MKLLPLCTKACPLLTKRCRVCRPASPCRSHTEHRSDPAAAWRPQLECPAWLPGVCTHVRPDRLRRSFPPACVALARHCRAASGRRFAHRHPDRPMRRRRPKAPRHTGLDLARLDARRSAAKARPGSRVRHPANTAVGFVLSWPAAPDRRSTAGVVGLRKSSGTERPCCCDCWLAGRLDLCPERRRKAERGPGRIRHLCGERACPRRRFSRAPGRALGRRGDGWGARMRGRHRLPS